VICRAQRRNNCLPRLLQRPISCNFIEKEEDRTARAVRIRDLSNQSTRRYGSVGGLGAKASSPNSTPTPAKLTYLPHFGFEALTDSGIGYLKIVQGLGEAIIDGPRARCLGFCQTSIYTGSKPRAFGLWP